MSSLVSSLLCADTSLVLPFNQVVFLCLNKSLVSVEGKKNYLTTYQGDFKKFHRSLAYWSKIYMYITEGVPQDFAQYCQIRYIRYLEM